MSILEDVGSTASDTSPTRATQVVPRSRLRSRSSRKLDRQLAAADDQHHRGPHGGTEEDTGEEDEGSVLEQLNSNPRNGKRYEFRERRSKPDRFDQNLYDEVFDPMLYARTPEHRANPKKRRRRGSSQEPRKRRGGARRSKNRRLREQEKEEQSDEDEDDDEVEVDDQGNYDMTDESDIEVINRRIEAQARAEALTEQALAPRQDRATRYALRSRESDVGTTSSISPSKNSNHEHHDAGAEDEDEEGEEEDEEENEVDEENGSQSDNEDNDDDDRDEAKDEGDVDDEEDTNDAGRRYSLRQRTNSRLVSRSEQYEDSDRVVGRKTAKSKAAINKVARNRRGRASSFITNDTERRYSLRDRSKVQRAEPETPPKDPNFAAYAEYAKRQSGRKPNTGTRHRFVFPSKSSSNKNRRRRHHRRRSDSLSSSSSSSSSSSDMYKYDDDSDGGMRRNSPGKGSGVLKRQRTGKNARADITPVEVDRSITWESVGGLEKHIEALKEMVMLPLLYPEFYEKYKINPPSGVLFYGPPGTGKTLLARALANSCSEDSGSLPATMRDGDAASTATADGETEKSKRQVTFYMRKGADCLSKWVGEAERQLRLLFEEAKRNQPSIIFFDEIDGLAPVRSAKQDQIHASIVSTLLALMDGMDSRGRVVVIGATNRLDSIDPALRRPGRFDRELGFKLPNVRERQKMLGIHSKKWRPTLTESFIQEIAEHTVGYCGADIKALCAEAALCSLRRTYPQVYGSQDKLLIDLDRVVVSRGDFLKAIKKITPASHRTVSSFAAPLPRPVKILLEASLKLVLKSIARRFPLFPLDRQAIDENFTSNSSTALDDESSGDDDADGHDIYVKDNHDDCDICHGDEGELLCCDSCPGAFHASCIATVESLSGESSMCNAGENENDDDDMWFCPDCAVVGPKNAEARKKRLHMREKTKLLRGMPLHVGFPRVLITGTPGMGQEYIGAGLLHALEGLTHFSLDYPSLVADPNTHHAEEALIYRMNEAQKCLPCVLYMPHAEMWWENTTESMHVTLKMMLMNMQIKANLPVLFLACTSSSSGNLPVGLIELFRHNETIVKSSIVFQLKETPKVYRKEHFEQVFAAFATPPNPMRRKTKARVFEKLPLAPVLKKPDNRLFSEMLQKQKERDQHFLRELRIFLGQVLDYATSQKAYTPFYFPVNPDEVPDYYLIVDNPMDLSTMREKLNDGEYSCFEQFMADIRLIVRNANVFNPRRSATRHIAYAAGTMKDNIMSYAHRFRSHQGYDLFAKCREISKRLQNNSAAVGTGVTSITSALTTTSTTQVSNSTTRTSARIRGVKAPEPWLEDMPKKRETSSSLRRGITSKENIQSEKTISKTVVIKEEQLLVTQWFDEDNDESIESATKSVTTEKKTLAKSERKRDADVDLTASGAGDDDEVVVFHNGDHVFVKSRTHPGMNREGGAGVIARTNDDGSYNVKYILGGSEKYVPGKYITRLTESAVKESVRNQRNGATTESPPRRKAAPDISAIADTKVATEIKMDYFNKLVWPILVEEGWRREDLVEIVEATENGVAGFATEVAKFYPPKTAATDENSDDDNSEPTEVELEGVSEALTYIKGDIQLSAKCFGKRFAVELLDDVAFGSAGSEDVVVVEESRAASIAKDDTSDSPAESTGDVEMDDASAEPVTPSTSKSEKQQQCDESVHDSSAEREQKDDDGPDENDDDEEKEEPAFIYDKERMDTALEALVAKSGAWTVEKMSNELMYLNKLAYPFRQQYDRTRLMQLVEEHVESLK